MVRSAADSKIQVVVFTNRGAYTLFICASYRMDTLSGGGGSIVRSIGISADLPDLGGPLL